MELDWVNGIVEFRVTGPLTAMVIVDAFALLNASPRNQALRGIVWDLSTADISNLNTDALRAALRARPMPDNVLDTLRVAAVTEASMGTDGEDVGDRWIALGKMLDGAERRMFQNLQDARIWAARIDETDRASLLRVGTP